MSLKSYRDPTKGFSVIVQQEYDDESVKMSYMAEVNQKVAAFLSIFPFILEGRL